MQPQVQAQAQAQVQVQVQIWEISDGSIAQCLHRPFRHQPEMKARQVQHQHMGCSQNWHSGSEAWLEHRRASGAGSGRQPGCECQLQAPHHSSLGRHRGIPGIQPAAAGISAHWFPVQSPGALWLWLPARQPACCGALAGGQRGVSANQPADTEANHSARQITVRLLGAACLSGTAGTICTVQLCPGTPSTKSLTPCTSAAAQPWCPLARVPTQPHADPELSPCAPPKP